MWQRNVFSTNCMATQQIVATLAVVFHVRHYDQQHPVRHSYPIQPQSQQSDLLDHSVAKPDPLKKDIILNNIILVISKLTLDWRNFMVSRNIYPLGSVIDL